ncbi:hypothetical protein CGCF413_v004921 [Colletotrichum fructicola]|nr:hypothetical protein CGCF413_v004921 [Colletotrichum fructicola]
MFPTKAPSSDEGLTLPPSSAVIGRLHLGREPVTLSLIAATTVSWNSTTRVIWTLPRKPPPQSCRTWQGSQVSFARHPEITIFRDETHDQRFADAEALRPERSL